MDGVGRTIKHQVFRDIKSNKMIKNAKHFAANANKPLNGIKSQSMYLDDLLMKLDSIQNLSRIVSTL